MTSWSVMSQTINFKKSYGNNGFDYGRGILQQHDSSYLITGSSSSYNVNSTDAFIMHIDSMGNLLNTNFYGGSESDWGEKIVLGADSSIAVAGYTNSIGSGGYDFYFFNCNQNKGMNYEKAYGGSGWDFAYDLIPLADSGYIIAGETSSFDAVGSDGYLIRINKFGDTIWTHQFGPGNGNDVFKALQKINDTEFLVCGAAQHADSSHEDGYLRRMDIDGNIVWENYYGEQFSDVLLAMDTLENYVVVSGTREINNAENKGFWMLKIGFDGVLDWSNGFTGNGDFVCTGLAINDQQNTIVVAQETESPDIPTYSGGNDILLSGYDFYSSGWNASLNMRYGAIGIDEARDVMNTSDLGTIFVGSVADFSTGGSNVMVVKLGANLSHPDNDNWEEDSILNVSNETLFQEGHEIKVFPNPFEDILHISSNNLEGEIEIFNLSQQLVFNGRLKNKTQQIDLSNLESGMYLIRIIDNSGLIQQRRIIKP